MTIDEAEAELKRCEEAHLRTREAVREATKVLLAALVEAKGYSIGATIERKNHRGETERAQIAGFRHRWGRNIAILAHPLKKDGTPSKNLRDLWQEDWKVSA
jgi:hypothetical protein